MDRRVQLGADPLRRHEDRHHQNGDRTHAGRSVPHHIPGAGAAPAHVLLSAHYDGHDAAASAIDNASGVVAAIAAAEALRGVVSGLVRGLELALLTAEDWALIGSRHHLDTLNARDRGALVLNVNLDSVARDAALTAITGGFPGADAFVACALRSAGLEIGVHHGFMENSDHAHCGPAPGSTGPARICASR